MIQRLYLSDALIAASAFEPGQSSASVSSFSGRVVCVQGVVQFLRLPVDVEEAGDDFAGVAGALENRQRGGAVGDAMLTTSRILLRPLSGT